MAKVVAGKVLNLDMILGTPKNRVKRCGIEMEGAWNKPVAGVKIERDGSVFANKGDQGQLIRAELPGFKCGEVALGPMQPAQAPRAMKKYYPQLVDASCGLHVHMSFETVLQYALLADSPDYQETMAAYLEKWAKEEGLPKDHLIWDRLAGKSEYCQKKFWADKQIQQANKDHDKNREGHRYTLINYCWRNGTVECRVLPMFDDVEKSIRAVRRVIDITNAYLIAVDKTKPNKGVGKVDVPGGKIVLQMEMRDGKIYQEYYEE